MPEVNRYRVLFYGSSDEKPTLKAKVELYSRKGGEQTPSMGKLRFWEGNLPKDENKKGMIVMNLPSTTLEPVLEMLRCETPIYFAFHEGRGVLGTAIELIGRPVVVSQASEPKPPPEGPKE